MSQYALTAKKGRSQLGDIGLDVWTIFNTVTDAHKFPLDTHIRTACARIASLITYPKDAQIMYMKARMTYANVRIRIACIRIGCARIQLEYVHTRRVKRAHKACKCTYGVDAKVRNKETVTMQFFILYFSDSPFSL